MEDNKLLDKIEKKIIQILKKEGGASGLAPLKKAVDKMDKPKGFNLTSVLKKMKNVEKHKESDYILTPINENLLNRIKQIQDFEKTEDDLYYGPKGKGYFVQKYMDDDGGAPRYVVFKDRGLDVDPDPAPDFESTNPNKIKDFLLSVKEGEGSTLNISKADMEKLHKDGKLEKDGHKIIFKVNEDAVKLSKRNMTMYGKKMKRESLEEIAGLFEKLCKKGQAYRRKRMAAGEKSSAYLSGRAVKVCKGQIKGEGK